MHTNVQTKKPGRPASPDSLTGAQRQAAYRERMRGQGKATITVEISTELVAALEKFMKSKDVTKAQVIEAALRDRFMRKR